ncbi:MAG TPA: flagellar basal-body rod protein FlgG [Pirellulaceae bacterium]|nr:flagellar basal-body rod protein FlgG [Pirellulaceae bacterium]
MSVQSLYTAATGMESLQSKLNVIANNLANVNTTGFKSDRANFEDLFYRHEIFPGSQDQANNFTATGTQIGLGVRMQSTQTQFQQGAFQETGGPLDLAIEGKGFLQVVDPVTSQNLYTRAGNLSLNAQGTLVVGSAQTGRVVVPQIQIPNDANGISISSDGRVFFQQAGNPQMQPAGQLQLATFFNPEGLLKIGENLYSETISSGSPQQNNPGTQGAGVLRQGFLELSNVEPVRELIDLITTQRSFEMNSQVIDAGNQILQVITNLARN